jgi:MFS family permease
MITDEDKMRIQLSIVFITIYTGIILAYKDRLNFFNQNFENSLSQLLFGIFILCGIIIVFFLFLYLLFTALELNFHKEKELAFGQDISLEKISKLKKIFYNMGIDSIFTSLISYPVYFFHSTLSSAYKLPWSFLIWLFCLLLIMILLNILFSKHKLIVKKNAQYSTKDSAK